MNTSMYHGQFGWIGGTIPGSPADDHAETVEVIPAPTDADDTTDDTAIDTPDLTGPEAEALIGAGWHLRHIAALRHERRIVETVYRAEMDRITNLYRERLQVITRKLDWHAEPLVQLHARLLAANPARKTIVLPHGTLKSTTPSAKAAPRIEIVDEEAALAWAASIDAATLTRTKVTVAIGNLKRRLALGAEHIDDPDTYNAIDTITGEAVPGIVAFKPVTTYTIDAVDLDLLIDPDGDA